MPAIGPGVGGINTCETYRPQESATDIATEDTPVRFTNAFRIGFKITNPESQNTGMETTHPISSIANSG